jgi:WD40 repeat protein
MSRIFISYRRDDTGGYAGRLYDRLVDHFGQEHVFMDIDTIEPGLDFVEVIEHAVGQCDVLLALIGRQWLTITDAKCTSPVYSVDFSPDGRTLAIGMGNGTIQLWGFK